MGILQEGPSKDIKDHFPNVRRERVDALLQDPDYIALRAMNDLSNDLKRMKADGIDVSQAQKHLESLWPPTSTAIMEKLTKKGWNKAEQGAALWLMD